MCNHEFRKMGVSNDWFVDEGGEEHCVSPVVVHINACIKCGEVDRSSIAAYTRVDVAQILRNAALKVVHISRTLKSPTKADGYLECSHALTEAAQRIQWGRVYPLKAFRDFESAEEELKKFHSNGSVSSVKKGGEYGSH